MLKTWLFCYFLPYADNYADTVVLGEPPASSPLVISAAVALRRTKIL